MKVLKVIVDELLLECGECMFCDFARDDSQLAYSFYCTLTDKDLDDAEIPNWCPLVTTDKLLHDVQSPFRNWGNQEESDE